MDEIGLLLQTSNGAVTRVVKADADAIRVSHRDRVSSSHSPDPAAQLLRIGLRVLPVELFRMKHVKTLTLDGNYLYSLPSEIALLTTLEQLWVCNNQLEFLPPELGLLTRLKGLHVRHSSGSYVMI
jgi:Leucine-rich repeat (LRR) protein